MAYLLQVTLEVIYEIELTSGMQKSNLNKHLNGEMNKTMDDLEQFVDNMVLKREK